MDSSHQVKGEVEAGRNCHFRLPNRPPRTRPPRDACPEWSRINQFKDRCARVDVPVLHHRDQPRQTATPVAECRCKDESAATAGNVKGDKAASGGLPIQRKQGKHFLPDIFPQHDVLYALLSFLFLVIPTSRLPSSTVLLANVLDR